MLQQQRVVSSNPIHNQLMHQVLHKVKQRVVSSDPIHNQVMRRVPHKVNQAVQPVLLLILQGMAVAVVLQRVLQ